MRPAGRSSRSYSWDRRDVSNITPRNPNEQRYRAQSNRALSLPDAADLPGRPLQRHLRAAVAVPGRGHVHRPAGEYFPRIVQVRNALNTLVNVPWEGQAGRYEWVKLADLRFSKLFRFGKHSIEGMFDLFNVTNTSVVLRRVTTNGPNYLQPLATGGIDAASANPIPAPRIFRLSVRYKF